MFTYSKQYTAGSMVVNNILTKGKEPIQQSAGLLIRIYIKHIKSF